MFHKHETIVGLKMDGTPNCAASQHVLPPLPGQVSDNQTINTLFRILPVQVTNSIDMNFML